MLALLALILGLLAGLFFKSQIPSELWLYIALLIVAVFDALVYGLSMQLRKVYDQRSLFMFLIGNYMVAIFLTALGEQLGVQLYLCAFFAFGVRIFQNLARAQNAFLVLWDRRRYRKAFEKQVQRHKPGDPRDGKRLPDLSEAERQRLEQMAKAKAMIDASDAKVEEILTADELSEREAEAERQYYVKLRAQAKRRRG
ncbi:MAG: small basic family protein [Eubacteriales bacterium]|nr:small basic family protein [Eubacteriales bacterium]